MAAHAAKDRFLERNRMKHRDKNSNISHINEPQCPFHHTLPLCLPSALPPHRTVVCTFYQQGVVMSLRMWIAYNLKMFYIYKQGTLCSDWEAAYSQLSQRYLLLAASMQTAVDGESQLRSRIAKARSENARLKSGIPAHSSPPSQPNENSSFHPPLHDIPKEKTTRTGGKRHPRLKKQCSTELDSIGSACIYECTYLHCGRVYSSPVSLNLHIKTKHNGGTKKEREACAKLIIEAQQRGDPPPQVDVTFPPNFLKEFRVTYQYMKKYNM